MEFDIPEIKQRDIAVDLTTDLIVAIIGPRRSGKTYLCFQLMQGLMTGGTPRSNILYLNFEDEKLLGATASDADAMLDIFHEVFRIDGSSRLYLFLDEIQNVQDWDAWVRRLHDTRKNIQLVLTGSSTKLLSKEIATRLRGRVLNWEVFPLSFKEYLSWHGVRYNIATLPESKDSIEIRKRFNKYVMEGGFPALFTNPQHATSLLQSYYDVMILKDIVERHGVKEVKKLRLLGGLLFESTGREMSYTRLANKLKSAGIDISKNTVIDFISHFEDAYVFFQSMKFEYSLALHLGAIKKVYCIDNGLLNAASFKFSDDKGRLLENIVYISLRRGEGRVFYHRGKHECDFLVQEKDKVVAAIQVTEVLLPDNEGREIGGLVEAMAMHDLTEGTVITADQHETRVVDGNRIRVLPAWLWLLGGK
jgi:predicted AAA+ superfamily ATPase